MQEKGRDGDAALKQVLRVDFGTPSPAGLRTLAPASTDKIVYWKLLNLTAIAHIPAPQARKLEGNWVSLKPPSLFLSLCSAGLLAE